MHWKRLPQPLRMFSTMGFFCLLIAPGCGPAPVARPMEGMTTGPHSGIAFQLPDGKGIAELVSEPVGRGKAATSTLVIYFVQPDGKTALSPAPTEVSLAIEGGATVRFQAEAREGDPAGGARFVPPPNTQFDDQIRGELSASLGGTPTKLSVVYR